MGTNLSFVFTTRTEAATDRTVVPQQYSTAYGGDLVGRGSGEEFRAILVGSEVDHISGKEMSSLRPMEKEVWQEVTVSKAHILGKTQQYSHRLACIIEHNLFSTFTGDLPFLMHSTYPAFCD